MSSALGMSPIDETYEDVRALGGRFASYTEHRTIGRITENDALAMFDDAFLKAYYGGWKPESKAAFGSWVYLKASYSLRDWRKSESKSGRTSNCDDLDTRIDPQSIEDPDEPTIFDAIATGDARRILEHVAANRELYAGAQDSLASARAARIRIREHLKQTYGWRSTRVNLAMKVIRQHLERKTPACPE